MNFALPAWRQLPIWVRLLLAPIVLSACISIIATCIYTFFGLFLGMTFLFETIRARFDKLRRRSALVMSA